MWCVCVVVRLVLFMVWLVLLSDILLITSQQCEPISNLAGERKRAHMLYRTNNNWYKQLKVPSDRLIDVFFCRALSIVFWSSVDLQFCISLFQLLFASATQNQIQFGRTRVLIDRFKIHVFFYESKKLLRCVWIFYVRQQW